MVHFTWTDPPDIGVGKVYIYSNDGDINSLYPDYSSPIDEVAAGVQEWYSDALADGAWCFGFRAFNGSKIELNTFITKIIIVRDGSEVVRPPQQPLLSANYAGNGSYILRASCPYIPGDQWLRAAKVKFFANDGAGGAVDYATPLTGDFINTVESYQKAVAALTIALAGTDVSFGLIAYNADGYASEHATEINIIPTLTLPLAPTFTLTGDRL